MSLASSPPYAPLLKAGVLHAQVEGGTYIELGDRSFFIRGDKLYAVIVRLLESFSGTRTAAEIRAALPEKLAPLFDQLLEQLLRQRMLTGGPPEAIADDHPFAATLHFLRDATPRWQDCFAEWSQARISVMGAAELLPLLARGLLSAGAGRVAVIDMEDKAAALSDGAAASCERLSPAAALRLPKQPRSLLLYLGADAPDEATLARIEALAGVHETTIVAAVCAGTGIVSPDCHAGLATWRNLAARVTDTGAPFTRAAFNVLASLLAFEALQERIAAWSDDAGEAGRRKTQFRVVRSDGSVSSHDSAVFLASGRSLGSSAAEAEEALVAPADPSLTRFFDPAAGLFSDAAVPGPEYPLAHRAVTLHYASAYGEACTRTLYTWGLDPDDADRRLMAQAFATLLAQRQGHVPAPGISPLVAASSPEQASAQATAYAIATLPDFLCHNPPCVAAISSDNSAAVQMLARLIHLYAGALPAVWTAGDAQAGACIVWAKVAEWTVAAVAPDIDAGVAEALGEALSAFQLGRLTDGQDAWPLAALRRLPLADAASSNVDNIAAPSAAAVHYVAADDPSLPAGLCVGHARVTGA
jgi:hypothetical protein